MRWVIVTAAYPPQEGGVSDYTRQVARGLACAGDFVHVLAPASGGMTPGDPGVIVHRLSGHFDRRSLSELTAEIDDIPRPHTILLQYVAQGFGFRGMNVPFCLWVHSRRGQPLWIMFHEVATPIRWRQPFRHNILGAVHRLMAWLLVRSACRILLSTPAWEPLVRRLGAPPDMTRWLPVPSNVAVEAPADKTRSIRDRIGAGLDTSVVGHFGTFGQPIRPRLAEVLIPLLQRSPHRIGLLLGRGGEEFAREIARSHPDLAERIRATGGLAAGEIASHLLASDILVQPYEDGVSSRRSSLMAGLALGRPIVTNDGPASESIWREEAVVALAPGSWREAGVRLSEELLADPARRSDMGRRAKALYDREFSIEQTIRRLRSEI